METGIRVLLLTAALSLLGGCAIFHRHRGAQPPEPTAGSEATTAASDNDAPEEPPSVIEPQVERRKIKVPKIDAQNFEIGASYGEISIESYTAAPVTSLKVDYHITEDFFFDLRMGYAKAGLTSVETLGGNIRLLTDAERRFTYYNLGLGYNFLPGEVFLGRGRTLTSGFYLLGGVGSVKFEGDQHFSVNFGGGFRVLPTDWLALHIEAQDLVFKSDFLGTDRLRNNLQAHIGFSIFF